VQAPGTTVLITGANSGIGLETARALAARGWRTLMLCRSEERANAAVAEIRRTVPDAKLEVVPGDLSLQTSVRAAAADVLERTDRLEVLVNNAGIVARSMARTAEDHDVMLATNQLGPFLLTELLRPALATSAPARIVNVASDAHRFAKTVDLDRLDTPASYGFLCFRRYGETKLMNILWTRELARRLAGTGVTANAVHPGAVRSNLGNPAPWQRAIVQPFMKTAEQGASTSVFLATDPSVEGVTGTYWAKSTPADDKLSSAARDDALAARLWTACEALTGQS
jgi:retinol dehydrogenase 12